MLSRTPSVSDLAQISRDEWERVCAALMALEEGVNKVEDRRGKGNGLDGWRLAGVDVIGYQYRRFEDRFGPKQAAKIKANIALAKKRAHEELGGKLTRFVFMPNIDMEPGHRGSSGELGRWESVKKWASDEGVVLELRGVTRTHALLCKHPQVKPELFEDLGAKLDDQGELLRQLLDDFRKRPGGTAAERRLKKLIKEAETHFERSLVLGSEEEMSAALSSVDDAWRLADDEDVSNDLKGNILTLSSALRMRAGSLQEAKEHALKAVDLLGEESSMPARGNLGLILIETENFGDAENEFRAILKEARQRDDNFETAKALLHLTRVSMALGDNDSMMRYAGELQEAVGSLELESPENPGQANPLHVELLFYATGLRGQIYVHLARGMPHRDIEFEGYRRAEETFRELLCNAKRYGLKELCIVTMSNLAQCIWFQNRLDEAAQVYQETIIAAVGDFKKFEADAFFNLALINEEQERLTDGLENMLKAHSIYGEIGDNVSLLQAEHHLTRLVTPSS